MKAIKTVALIAIPLALGIYLFLRKPKKGEQIDIGILGRSSFPLSDSPWENYIVIGSSKLSVWQEPTSLSSIIETLPVGNVIMARPSKANLWYEYSEDGESRLGFVAGQSLKKA